MLMGSLVLVMLAGGRQPRRMESSVAGRYKSKKLTLIQESARGAQRGLLVILASALLWLLAIWAGYHYLG
jgi:hypothetical protein